MLADYVNALRIKNKMTIEEVARLSDNPEPTVKNILTKKTLNPGFEVGCSLIYAVGGSVDEFFGYAKKEVSDQSSMVYLKEFYEKQMSEQKAGEDARINNITSHYEKRLDELREKCTEQKERHEERIAEINEHIDTIKLDKRWFRIATCILAFALVSLLVLEMLTPGMGWIKF
jgi:predicted transcriptional regulator